MDKRNRVIFEKIEETNRSYRIQATIGVRCLSLIIIQEADQELLVYKTPMILEQNLRQQAEKLSMNVDVYFKKLISFFENTRGAKFNFTTNTLTITENVNSHLQVKYFQCHLEKVSTCHIVHLLDDLYYQKSQSEIKCNQVIQENELLQKDVIDYKTKLNELVDRKIIDEKTMLCNFVLLLNEKKKRIQHLNELLEAFRNNPDLADPVEVNIACNNKKKLKTKSEEQTPQVKEEISESESDESHQDIMTDEEHLDDLTKPDIPSCKYSDIFDESPTEKSIPKAIFPKSSTLECSRNIFPSTSKEIHSDEEMKEENESSPIGSHDNNMMNVDTQEWLDNL